MRLQHLPRCHNFRRHPYPVRTEFVGYAVVDGRTVRRCRCPDTRCRRQFFVSL